MDQSHAFDQKNQNDFDHYTELLSRALLDIAGNDALKPTVAELSRLTGMHRNTIRQRIWPLERLDAIKVNRRVELLKKRVSKEKSVDPVTLLTERLELSRIEVLYWFNKNKDTEESFLILEKKYQLMESARDTYKNLMADANKRLLVSEKEIVRLRDVISILEAAQAEKNA